MAVITGGKILKGGVVAPGTIRRPYPVSGAPTGSTLAGTVAVGDFVQDVNNGNLYEYTEPGAVPTFTRRDTV